jgi:hypothetical protein
MALGLEAAMEIVVQVMPIGTSILNVSLKCIVVPRLSFFIFSGVGLATCDAEYDSLD